MSLEDYEPPPGYENIPVKGAQTAVFVDSDTWVNVWYSGVDHGEGSVSVIYIETAEEVPVHVNIPVDPSKVYVTVDGYRVFEGKPEHEYGVMYGNGEVEICGTLDDAKTFYASCFGHQKEQAKIVSRPPVQKWEEVDLYY